MKKKDINPVDERVRKSKEKILSVAVDLLSEVGLSGVSVDEISRRSGVAKTTIYRHWESRTELLKDACLKTGSTIDVKDTGLALQDIESYLLQLAKALMEEKWATILPSVLDMAERDSEISKMYSELQKSYSAPLENLIKRAIKLGDLPKSTKTQIVVAMLIGPLFFQRWFARKEVNKNFVSEVVSTVLRS